MHDSRERGMLKRANPHTIHDKVLVGYQGWFTCAGDGEPIGPGHHGWLHWFNHPMPNGGRPNTDFWPDTSEYSPSELYPAPGLKSASGDPVYLFSSRNPTTVHRHFHWMALHGVDGAFLQRFAGQCEIKPGNMGIRNLRDEVGDRVREAAEAEGRVFAIMYDVSGVSPDKICHILEQDWTHLLREKHILDSPNYLREGDRPVLALWGFGFNGRHHTPELVRGIAEFFRASVPQGVYLVAGTPGHWRTSSSDADRNPEFVRLWTESFDAICPWTIGRYGSEEAADRWGEERIKADADYLRKLAEDGGRKVDYLPVVFPGGSGFNLSEGKWLMNDIKRNGGRFLWRQIYNARHAGVRTIYGAMWDEYDEGTAYMPIVSYASQLPVHPSFRFLALDVDGYDLPSDWYMRIMGFAAEAFHGECILLDTFPSKELQDYWSTRPHYEDVGGSAHDQPTDVDAVTRAFRQWEVSQGATGVPDDAPPPYSLEDTSSQQQGPPPGQHVQQPQNPTGVAPSSRPPVPADTRPSSSNSTSYAAAAGAAAIPLAAAAIAHTVSSSSAKHTPPPPVNMVSRPPQSAKPHHQPAQIVMAPPPAVPPRRRSSSQSPPRLAVHTHPGHSDVGRQHAHHTSLGHGSHGLSTLSPALELPAAGGHHGPVPAEYAQGRARSRSRSRSGSRERRAHGAYEAHAPHAPHGSHGHGPGPLSPVSPHGHTLWSPHGRGRGFLPHVGLYPQLGVGLGTYRARPEAEGYGAYAPAYAQPGGYGHGHEHGEPQGPAGYYPPPGEHPAGYEATGYGYGPRYDGVGAGPSSAYAQPQEAGHGYLPHPSSSQYYGSYGPGTSGGSYAGGSGRGRGIQGGIAHVIDGIRGRPGLQQLEETVKTLAHSGSSLLNKLK